MYLLSECGCYAAEFETAPFSLTIVHVHGKTLIIHQFVGFANRVLLVNIEGSEDSLTMKKFVLVSSKEEAVYEKLFRDLRGHINEVE